MGKITFKRGSKGNEWYETIDENTSFSDWLDEEIKVGFYVFLITVVVIGLGILVLFILKSCGAFEVEYKEPEFLIKNEIKIESVSPAVENEFIYS